MGNSEIKNQILLLFEEDLVGGSPNLELNIIYVKMFLDIMNFDGTEQLINEMNLEKNIVCYYSIDTIKYEGFECCKLTQKGLKKLEKLSALQ